MVFIAIGGIILLLIFIRNAYLGKINNKKLKKN